MTEHHPNTLKYFVNQKGTRPRFFKPMKLTSVQREEISYRRGEGARSVDLALEFGVSRSYIDSFPKRERP